MRLMADRLQKIREALGDSEWSLGRGVVSSLPEPPKRVELRSGWLSWLEKLEERREAGRQLKAKSADSQLLDQFLRLETASDLEIRDFVLIWGPLWLCEKHWLPAVHQPIFGGRCSKCGSEIDDGCDGWPREEKVKWEPAKQRSPFHRFLDSIEAYRAYAKRARMLLEIATAIRKGQKIDKASWPNNEAKPNLFIFIGRASDVELLAQHLNSWLWWTGMRPRVVCRSGKLTMDFDGNRLLGALGLQILAAVTGSTEIAKCAECPAVFLSKRQIPKGRARYCDDCGLKVAQRRASKKYYDAHRLSVLKRRRKRRLVVQQRRT
jgi:hypothetical protein